MIEKVFIVLKHDMATGQAVFEKVFFKREMAEIYIQSCKDPEVYEIRTFVECKREDGIANVI